MSEASEDRSANAMKQVEWETDRWGTKYERNRIILDEREKFRRDRRAAHEMEDR